MKTIKKISKSALIGSLLLAIGFACFLIYETQDEINATPENVEEILESFYTEERLAGFSVSVFSSDSVIYSGGFGFADKENRIPYTKATKQYIASISKTLIGVSLVKAEELALLSIDDPINKYLPFEVMNPKHPSVPITLRQLATHTSSLDYNEEVVESLYVEPSEENASLAPFMTAYFGKGEYGEVLFSEHAPGTHWNYSNIGAALAAYIIECRSKMTFAAFTQQHIFDPLELNNSSWFSTDDSTSSAYYEADSTGIKKVQTSGVSLYPARDLYTNVEDLTTFCQALMRADDRLLSKASYSKMLGPQLDAAVSGQEDDNNGLFFMIDRNQHGIPYQLTGHDGGDNCINTMMYFDPKAGLGYIFIGNTGHADINWGSHIRVYRTLVSVGDHIRTDSGTVSWSKRVKHRTHNYYNRIRAFF